MPLIEAHHYTRRRTADPMHVFLWKDGDEVIAAAVFTSPINKFFGRGATELSRLVRTPECSVPLTKFLSQCIRWLKKNTELAFIISYADESVGHKGYIYQAANFIYVQKRKSGVLWKHKTSGAVVSGRSMDQSAKTRRGEYERLPSSVKHLYIMPLAERREQLLNRFGWAPLPYPKLGDDLC